MFSMMLTFFYETLDFYFYNPIPSVSLVGFLRIGIFSSLIRFPELILGSGLYYFSFFN